MLLAKPETATAVLLAGCVLAVEVGMLLGAAQVGPQEPMPEDPERRVLAGPVRILRPRIGGLYPLAYSPDGSTLATSGGKALGTNGNRSHILLWDPATGEEKGQLIGKQEPVSMVRAFAFSPDGKTLASGVCLEKSAVVQVWEVATGKLKYELRISQVDIDAVAFSPDGRTLAAAETGGKVYLWDPATGKELHQLRREWPYSHYHDKYGIAFSPDGKTLAAGGSKVSVWDVASGKRLQQFEGEGYFVAFFPDGKTLAAGGCCFLPGPDGTGRIPHPVIYLWDLPTGRERRLDNWQSVGVVKSLALSPDGRALVSGGPDRVRLWEVATGKVRRLLGGPGTDCELRTSRGVHRVPHATNHVVFSPDGRMLATSSDGSDKIFLWDAVLRPSSEGPKTRKPSREELKAQWADLASEDATRAYQAVCALVGWPEQSVPLLKERLRPVPPRADPKRIAQLLLDLDSEQFEVRQKATEELEERGDAAGPALQAALAGKPSLEVRRRVEQLLEKLHAQDLPAERLRVLRATEVLEHIATPAARQVLEALAQGEPADRLTREAKASLERLAKRAEGKP